MSWALWYVIFKSVSLYYVTLYKSFIIAIITITIIIAIIIIIMIIIICWPASTNLLALNTLKLIKSNWFATG